MQVPSLVELIRAGVEAGIARVHTSLPGIVQKFHAGTATTPPTVDVRPALKAPYFDPETGLRVDPADLPVIPNVPIAYPCGGGYLLAYPLAAGNEVTLVFSELNTSDFRIAGQVSEPLDVRRHGLGSPVAIPGPISDKAALADFLAAASGVVLGRDGHEEQIRIDATEIKLGATASSFVALADKVLTELQAIRSAFNSHIHAETGTNTAVPTTPMGAPSSVAATKVKAK